MKKIIFSDYDGTLNTSDEDIKINIEAIEKFRDNGNLFVIATGRSYLDLKRKLNIYPIPYDYLILNHGGAILDRNNNVFHSCIIPKQISLNILEKLKGDKNVENIILFDTMKKDIKEVSNNLTKIMIEINNKESAINLSNQINNQWKNDVKSYVILTDRYSLVEIISIETDKGKAIEKILQKENINDENVYTIGDGSNDVEMISKYHGYGMRKSEDIVYTVTDKLCNTVADLINIIN